MNGSIDGGIIVRRMTGRDGLFVFFNVILILLVFIRVRSIHFFQKIFTVKICETLDENPHYLSVSRSGEDLRRHVLDSTAECVGDL